MRISEFRKGVLASLFAALVWFVGGRVLNPIGQRLFPANWSQILEWLHALGCLAFLILVAVWLVLRRHIRVPHIDIVTNYPLAIPATGKATLIEWRDKNTSGEGGRVDLVGGSIHLELWNGSGGARTQRSRPVTFGRA